MSTAVLGSSAVSAGSELGALRRHQPLFLVAGLLLTALGALAIGWSCLTSLTLVTVWIFGLFLLGGGAAEILSAFWAGRWRGRLLHLLVGAMYLVVGTLFITEPKDSAIRLTLLIAIFLIIGGVFRILHALTEGGPARASILLSGVVSLLLGVSIYRQWPVSGLWVIGLFIGIELLFSGLTWVSLAMAIRRSSGAPQAA